MSGRAARPSAWPTAGAFFLGLLLGTALVGPEVPGFLALLPSPASFGPVGTVLLVGVLSIVAFVLGFTTIYLGLFLVGNR